MKKKVKDCTKKQIFEAIYNESQTSIGNNNCFIFDRLELTCHSHSGWTNLEIINLITKTLKALE